MAEQWPIFSRANALTARCGQGVACCRCRLLPILLFGRHRPCPLSCGPRRRWWKCGPVEHTRSRRNGGGGIGLSLCRNGGGNRLPIAAFVNAAWNVAGFTSPSVSDRRFLAVLSHLMLRLLASVAFFAVFSLPQISSASKPAHSDRPNFNGNWALDRKASTSIEPLMKHMGASYLQRKFANSANLKATYRQTVRVLTIAVRGTAVAMDETLHLDGSIDRRRQEIFGVTSLEIRTAWSRDHKELVETRRIETKRGEDGQLIIRRHPINEGKSMVLALSLELNGERDATSCRQLWRKQD